MALSDNDLEYAQRCVTIDRNDLDKGFVENPADLAYWGEKFARAVEVSLLSKLELREVEALTSLKIREAYKARDIKITESTIDSEVTLRPEVKDARRKHIDAEVQELTVKGYIDGIRVKASHLMSLGANDRKQMDPSPVVRQPAGAR